MCNEAGIAHGANALTRFHRLALTAQHGVEILIRVQVPVDGLKDAHTLYGVVDLDV